MPERFLNYWERERHRILEALQFAKAGNANHREVDWLVRLGCIVDDQVERWSREFAHDKVAA